MLVCFSLEYARHSCRSFAYSRRAYMLSSDDASLPTKIIVNTYYVGKMLVVSYGRELSCIMLLLDLVEGLLGSSIVFKLDDVDDFRSLDRDIYSSVGCVDLGFCVDPQEGRQYIECIVGVVLVVHSETIWDSCEECVKILHHGLGFTVLDCVDDVFDQCGSLPAPGPYIVFQ